MRFWKGILTWLFQSCFSVWLYSVHWNSCLEEITLTLRPLTRSHCVILLHTHGEGDSPLFTPGQKKTARHKWGLTVSWSTIGWSQMQSDCPEQSDDLCSMQNSLSCWSVPNRLEQCCLRPWPWLWVQTELNTVLWDPISSDNNHILLKAS